MSEKTKKIINIVVDVVVAVVLVFVLILAISAITSKAKGYDGYTEIFGKAYVAVASDSMEGENEDSFSKGDLIVVKLLSDDEKKHLEVGQVITFRTNQITNDDTYVLNSHRIIEATASGDGCVYSYTTQGDNNASSDRSPVNYSDIVGVYSGKASSIGYMFLFMKSSTGFFVCVVLPSLLVVVYFAVNLILVLHSEKKLQTAAANEARKQELEGAKKQALDDERERMRAEILAELQSKGEKPEESEPKDTDTTSTDSKE
jgi:signal peptidase I